MPTNEDRAETLKLLQSHKRCTEGLMTGAASSIFAALDAAIAAYEREPFMIGNNTKRAQKILSQNQQIAQLRAALEKVLWYSGERPDEVNREARRVLEATAPDDQA